MDFKRLELLMQVAVFDSFSRAATVLGIAQPALGRQMHKLEQECGVRIFYRHGRGISLTPEGQALIDRARPLLQQIAAIPGELQAENLAPHGTVTVGLMPAICSLFGLELVQAVRSRYPKLAVNIVTGYSGYVSEWLVDGRLDMAVLDDARRTSSILVDPICNSQLFLVLPTRAIEFEAPSAPSLSSLSQLPLVLPTRNHGLRRTVEFAAGACNLDLNVAYEADSLELLKRIVVKGLAATILGKPAIQSEIAADSVRAYQLESPYLQTRLVLATAAGRPHTKAVRVVEGEVKTLVAQLIHDTSGDYGLSLP
jgi:LysR family transcriptional regulator, nitrogen assimilation regulatory protein